MPFKWCKYKGTFYRPGRFIQFGWVCADFIHRFLFLTEWNLIWCSSYLWTFCHLKTFWSYLFHQINVSICWTTAHWILFTPFCVSFREVKISSLWNTPTSPTVSHSSSHRDHITFHSDVWCEYRLKVLTCIWFKLSGNAKVYLTFLRQCQCFWGEAVHIESLQLRFFFEFVFGLSERVREKMNREWESERKNKVRGRYYGRHKGSFKQYISDIKQHVENGGSTYGIISSFIDSSDFFNSLQVMFLQLILP